MQSLRGISDHLRIPYDDLVFATNDFSDKIVHNSAIFKGQLLWSGELIDIITHVYNLTDGEYMNMFQNSVLIHSSLKHKNIASFIGFHDEDDGSYLLHYVTKYETNESLNYYLADPNLTWLERLRICVGVGLALSYLHYDVGDNHFIIHGNIKSSSILLDDNWEAKLTNFTNSRRVREAQRHKLVQAKHSGTRGYMDPIYEKSKVVSHKSDVFSFGVVLFEVLCGREATIPNEDGEFLADLAKLHYEKGTLNTIVLPGLWEEMDKRSFEIFSKIAYYCLKEQRAQRPNMEQIVKKLEEAMKLQVEYEKEEESEDKSEVTSPNHWKGEKFEHLKIKLSDILSATDNFAETYCIGSGGYGRVYKAELHFESVDSSFGDMPKIRNTTVAIKRIFSREDKQGEHGFIAEIELLASCNHRNIVSLLGFCNEGPELILVYEYASNKSLDDYLGNNNNMTSFTWEQRLNICLNIAHGLNYLHGSNKDKEKIIHRDMKSANILLDENWEAKIADFGLSKFQQASTIATITIAGTEVYLDPDYLKTGILKKETDVYSFGVILFEILCGRLAYDPIYIEENNKGLGPIARRCFSEGTLEKLIDPILKEESDEIFFTQGRGLNKDSLATFAKIAYQCLAETQSERPTMEVVINELDQALSFQKNHNGNNLKISLEDIKLATQNFSSEYCIGYNAFWDLYAGELLHDNGSTGIVVKRNGDDLPEHEFWTELEILFEYKHENIIRLLGYCKEGDERCIVYDYASKGSLIRYLTDVSFTWANRLRICIDIGCGLDFLHGGGGKQSVVVHRGIRTNNILINDEWKATIAGFGTSLISLIDDEVEFDYNNSSTFEKNIDPVYFKMGTLTKESDIYSFGVVLVEIMCGRSLVKKSHNRGSFLAKLSKHDFGVGKLDKNVFKGIKEQSVPQSLITFQKIAFRCLHDKREERPTSSEVLIQLKKALEIQEDYEIWEAKLPKDYKEIIQTSKTSGIDSMTRKDLYDMLSKGILIKEGQLWFSLGSNGKRNRMISARKFSYKHRWSHKWRSIPESRFRKVAEMLDILNLKIQIKITTQFLSPGVNYGVHLVFRSAGLKKSLAKQKQMYVNLKYKMGSETLHAYFAKWREDEWMMIELCRFSNLKEDTEFDFLLESFSRGYSGSRTVYVEGIEFRAIDNVKHEENENIKETQEVLESKSDMNQMQQLSTNSGEIKRFENYDEDEKFSLSNVNKKKHYALSAKDALYDSSNVKLFKMKPSTESSFQDVVELLSTQVFRIKCKIDNQMLSPNTKYTCYLLFKLSEKCRGLHCPVVVRNLHIHKNKETGIFYFRSPHPWTLDNANSVPRERDDGWMEVNVWKFNANYEIQNDCIYINLKLITYEGTMRGLILRGLEFRPM